MKWLWQVLVALLGLAAALLVIAFLSLGAWGRAGLVLLVASGWGLAVWRKSRLFNLGFIGLAALAVHASALPIPTIASLASLVFSLAAWDLSEFSIRLREYDPQPGVERLIFHHLRRLAVIAGAGFLLGELALLLRLRIKFEVAIVIGLLAFLGLAQAIRYLRSLSD
jgi:hypothetical protein